ncbi:MAG: hypothetical protein HOP30_13780 [Cyclobacteriaceae bacterium]|nr:hypothetical protein [Cyclobacteriaceae bacterium]
MIQMILGILVTNVAYTQLLNIPRIGNEVMTETRYVEYQGSPYLYSTWKPSNIFDKEGKEYRDVQVKYDSYKDHFEVNQDGKILVLSKTLYPRIEFNFRDEEEDKSVRRQFGTGFFVDGKNTEDYFEIIHSGTYKFLKKIKTELVEETVSSYGTSSHVKRFVTTTHYYLIDGTNSGKEFKLNKKSLLEAAGDKRTSFEEVIQKSGIKIKKETDVVLLLMNF